jgi:hypothetical protein
MPCHMHILVCNPLSEDTVTTCGGFRIGYMSCQSRNQALVIDPRRRPWACILERNSALLFAATLTNSHPPLSRDACSTASDTRKIDPFQMKYVTAVVICLMIVGGAGKKGATYQILASR